MINAEIDFRQAVNIRLRKNYDCGVEDFPQEEIHNSFLKKETPMSCIWDLVQKHNLQASADSPFRQKHGPS